MTTPSPHSRPPKPPLPAQADAPGGVEADTIPLAPDEGITDAPVQGSGRPVAVGPIVKSDRNCRRCGYNLIGIEKAGKCPECGLPVIKSFPTRYGDQMIYAPLGWIEIYKLGCDLLLCGWIGGVISVLAWVVSGQNFFGAGAVIFCCVWTGGVWVSSRPRPPMPGGVLNPSVEWAEHRLVVRWSQVALTACGILLLGMSLVTPGAGVGSVLSLASAVLGLIGLGGVSAALWLQARYAEWACDEQLALDLRSAGVIAPITALIVAGGVALSGFGFLLVFAWALALIGLFKLTSVVVRLRSMASWAVHNHMTAALREQRMLDKASQLRKHGAGALGAPVASPAATSERPRKRD